MRICFVAYFNDGTKGDIGTKTIAKHLATCMSGMHEVMRLDIRDISGWGKIRTFKPDILHFVLAPTTSGFIAAKIISMYYPLAKVVMSAPNPTLSCRRLIKHLKPDIILTQSLESERVFQELGFRTAFLPNGVDIERFKPHSIEEKEQLREKYGFDKNAFIVLHVGPVIRKRNLEALGELHDEKTNVLIMGREPYDRRLCSELRNKGVRVITDYIEKIEEIYAFSDCYVFPTDPSNREASIEMPLSVLEAMACNLPVISTRFGALPMVFNEEPELIFIKSYENLTEKIEGIRNSYFIKNREVITPFSWYSVAQKMDGIYNRL